MSSTEFKADRRDILFVMNDVFEAGKLCEFSSFSDLNEELFTMTINEANSD